jgi:hypothetical protein
MLFARGVSKRAPRGLSAPFTYAAIWLDASRKA